MSVELQKEGVVRWEVDKVERMAGLVSYISAFLSSKALRRASLSVMGLLAVQANVPAGLRFVRREARLGDVEILHACDRLEFGGMVREARGIHAGSGFCAADARAFVECKTTGWGFRVGNLYANGAWPIAVKNALRDKKLSITPLEYVVALFAMRVWLER